ncbi:LytR/AlgR family response regulator transcription factor [Neptunitalea lumnitzerae]|uniref:DNA-binding response regulator n=1 Tax=Neptunitalea lumnitzerae TaxID=2965509 RepID=A0ABQ5MJL3_9FLAO|nr:LytTR family DNA-binding domain-containing protein [Neptunitalea sp. Y10]GLB49584.1 DNA-binding response regulator [Neptunitalea sp. Y10]
MKILIIEDENWVAEELAETLISIDENIEIVKILYSVSESINYLQTQPKVDLIFSDIQLGDGLSFEIMNNQVIKIPIIFCTAFDEYMLEAFDTNGIAYVLKPFSEKTIRKALLKYADLKAMLSKNIENTYESLISKFSTIAQQSSLIIKYRNRIIPIGIYKIALCYIENGITYIYTHNHIKYVHYETMDELEQKLSPMFFRVNRQYLINRNTIKNAEELFSRKLKIELLFSWYEDITASKEKKKKFIDWMK